MTLTLTDKEFTDLVEKVRAHTIEDAIDSFGQHAKLTREQAESLSKYIKAKGHSAYSYLLMLGFFS